MYDFFISHSSKDKDNIVDELVSALQNRGYQVWYDRNEILASDNIIDSVKNGLSCSYCIILVITNNFFASKWTLFETGFFNATGKNTIIPVLYDISRSKKEQIFNIIGNRKYLDMNTLTKEEAATELAKILRRTQEENKDTDTVTIENIKNIQKKLATYETVNSEIISLNIREYLSLFESNKEYVILAAKKIVKTVLEDLLKYKKCILTPNLDNVSMIKILNDNNIGSVNFREYVEFILRLNSEGNSNDYMKIINHALFNILTYYIHTRYPLKLSFEKLEVVYPESLTYTDFNDMFEIDKKVMREDLIASTDTAYGWFMHNKYTHIGVRDVNTQKIIGYFSVLPITRETYDQIISGDFKDNEFTSDNIEQYIFSNFYKVYIAGVGIDPIYQNTGAFITLYNALIDLVILLAREREIYISEILAEASTKQGEKFCKMVGMKKIASTRNDTDIYRLITIPPEFRHTSQKGKELFSLCKNKFEEYRDYFENK